MARRLGAFIHAGFFVLWRGRARVCGPLAEYGIKEATESEVNIGTNDTVSSKYLAERRDCAVAAKRSGDIGKLMREFARVGLRLGLEQMRLMACEVNTLAAAR